MKDPYHKLADCLRETFNYSNQENISAYSLATDIDQYVSARLETLEKKLRDSFDEKLNDLKRGIHD